MSLGCLDRTGSPSLPDFSINVELMVWLALFGFTFKHAFKDVSCINPLISECLIPAKISPASLPFYDRILILYLLVSVKMALNFSSLSSLSARIPRSQRDSVSTPRYATARLSAQFACRNCKRSRMIYRPENLPRVLAAAYSSQQRKGYAEADVEVIKKTRQRFCEEVSFRKQDEDISLAKAMLFIAAEDEAFLSFNRDMDACSVLNECREDLSSSSTRFEWSSSDVHLLAGRSISAWLFELDSIAKQAELELVSKEIGCHLLQVLEAVNAILFELRGFTMLSVLADPKWSYLHTVLSSASGSALMLSIIYIEVCRRLGVAIVGAQVGEEFLIWPQMRDTQELFSLSKGRSWFAKVNGRCLKDPRSRAYGLNTRSLPHLKLASNRDIIGIALANLKGVHWMHASKAHPNLGLTSPLRPVYHPSKPSKVDHSNVALLRPQDLRLATMASERLLILQPQNWALRRDHGMLLYHSRRYGEAVQELSICMALAPVAEAQILESFVEKLHLMRLESSWRTAEPYGTLSPLS